MFKILNLMHNKCIDLIYLLITTWFLAVNHKGNSRVTLSAHGLIMMYHVYLYLICSGPWVCNIAGAKV